MADEFIRGYRPVGDRPRTRELSMDYLQQTPRAAKLLKVLWSTEGKNCEGRTEEFSGEELPTDREAQLMCAGCPALETCGLYRDEAHPAWGTWGSTVKGRNLQKAMQDDARLSTKGD